MESFFQAGQPWSGIMTLRRSSVTQHVNHDLIGHVRQESSDIPEGTPIAQEELATGIAGLF
jgi:hypothetical protein